MANEPIKPNEWINARSVGQPQSRPKAEPKIDKELSDIVGRPIKVNDPRAIRAFAKYSSYRRDDDYTPSNWKDNPKIKDDIRKEFNERKYI